MSSRSPRDVYINDALLRGENDRWGGIPSRKERRLSQFAEELHLRKPRLAELHHEVRPRKATLGEAIAAAHGFESPLDALPNPDTPFLLHERDGLRWRICGGSMDPVYHAMRLAASGVLYGRAPDEIAERIRLLRVSRGRPTAPLDESRIRSLAQGGLAEGLVELALSGDRAEIQDAELAAELGNALRRDLRMPRAPELRVVRSVAHPEFTLDPIAPFLVALVAHQVVAAFLEAEPHVFGVGLAGGVHCATFVRAIGRGSSPFPDSSGARRFSFVPLTLEPFRDHRLPLADRVVGEMETKADHLLGPERVTARTFQVFGFLEKGKVGPLDTDAIALAREQYHSLDVAIYGCGDQARGGWLSRLLERVRHHVTAADPATDVCLNLLSANAEPIHLEQGHEFIGVNLETIRELSSNRRKLALLLTSGAPKGIPLTVVARAGCAGAIVCDQAAARAALEHLGVRRPRKARPRPPAREESA